MYTETQIAVNQPVIGCVLSCILYKAYSENFVSLLPSISPATRQRLIGALDDWHFEPHKLSEEEIITCTQLLFEALLRIEGMKATVGVSLGEMSHFMTYRMYRVNNIQQSN